MNASIVEAIDREVASLKQAKAVLLGSGLTSDQDAPSRRRGRPKGSKDTAKVSSVKTKRTRSA